MSLSRLPPLPEGLSLPKSEVLLSPRCRLQTTDWTECSTTCGMGISSRVTNNNPECRLVRETRLCQIRQCELQLELTLGLKVQEGLCTNNEHACSFFLFSSVLIGCFCCILAGPESTEVPALV